MNLDVVVNVGDYFHTVEHTHPNFSIELHCYLVRLDDRYFNRIEHRSHCWMEISKMSELDWMPADLPIIEKLVRRGLD